MVPNITLIFFVYGLAFFCMGLALLLEEGRAPRLAEGRVLRPLVIFGFVHGIHEWLEMFLDASDYFKINFPTQMFWLRIILLAISFGSLIIFGLRMLQPGRLLSRGDILVWSGGLTLYAAIILALAEIGGRGHADRLTHLDVLVRYLLGVTGAALAGIALLRQSALAQSQERPEVARDMRWAAWGFLLYACTQVVVPPSDMFPARILNTAIFTSLMGFPIQLVRAAAAIWITVSTLRAIQAAEHERQYQYELVQQARLEALEQVKRELEAREALRQELMRHIVIAQEEERARVARELHDETAQLLTALTLHLASLRQAVAQDNKASRQINELQSLGRQMSEGIYRLVRDLRPAQLDDLGLVAALHYLCDDAFKNGKLQIDLQVSGPRRRLDSLEETVLFRVAQEAVSNVSRHAQVKKASMQLSYTPGEIRLRVCDAGVGFDPSATQIPPRGWGLDGMRERAQSVGGCLHVLSAPDEGTSVEIIIPGNEVPNGNNPPDVSG